MPRVCTVCQHTKRKEIDEALVAGEPFRNIAKRFGTSSTAVFRHKEHLPKALVKAQEAREAAHADDLLGQVTDLRQRALRVLAAAEESGDLRAATGAIREARGCLELLGKVTGELFEKHAHLHAAAPGLEASRKTQEMLGAMPEEERRILKRIAQRMALRQSGDGSLRRIAREMPRLLDPELGEERSAELREYLAPQAGCRIQLNQKPTHSTETTT